MSLEVWVNLAGVLGFLLALFTFILTRLERRKKLEIELFQAADLEFASESERLLSDPDQPVIKVRFTNLGNRPIIIKPQTLEITGKTGRFKLSRYEYWGMERLEELMPPQSVREIGLVEEWVLEDLGITSPDKYDDESFNRLYPLTVSVKDHSGKIFKNSKFSYHEAVGEYVT